MLILTKDHPQGSTTRENCEAQLQWEFGVQKVHLGNLEVGPQEKSLDWTTLLTPRTKGVLQASVRELGFSNGGMFKCSEDHSESQEEHSERQSRGTIPRRSEACRMRSNLKVSRYRKLKSRVKGSLAMSQFVTLVFSIKWDA